VPGDEYPDLRPRSRATCGQHSDAEELLDYQAAKKAHKAEWSKMKA
jgi:hypothetical protein